MTSNLGRSQSYEEKIPPLKTRFRSTRKFASTVRSSPKEDKAFYTKMCRQINKSQQKFGLPSVSPLAQASLKLIWEEFATFFENVFSLFQEDFMAERKLNMEVKLENVNTRKPNFRSRLPRPIPLLFYPRARPNRTAVIPGNCKSEEGNLKMLPYGSTDNQLKVTSESSTASDQSSSDNDGSSADSEMICEFNSENAYNPFGQDEHIETDSQISCSSSKGTYIDDGFDDMLFYDEEEAYEQELIQALYHDLAQQFYAQDETCQDAAANVLTQELNTNGVTESAADDTNYEHVDYGEPGVTLDDLLPHDHMTDVVDDHTLGFDVYDGGTDFVDGPEDVTYEPGISFDGVLDDFGSDGYVDGDINDADFFYGTEEEEYV